MYWLYRMFEDLWPVPTSGGGKKGWDWPKAVEPKISKDRSFQSLPVRDIKLMWLDTAV
jgi:hypothetical protein